MSRMSLVALLLAGAAFVIGVAGPAIDPAVLDAQLGFAQRVAGRPEPEPPAGDAERSTLREEAGRWIARKLRERNERAEAERSPAVTERQGLFGPAAAYVVPAQFLLALAALAAALTDWLRTRVVRPNLVAAAIAGAAIAVPFAWGALGMAMGVAAVLIALVIVASLLSAIGG